MSPVWVVSMVLQWAVIAVLCVVVVALLRQVGALRLALERRGGGEESPALYEQVFAEERGRPLVAIALEAGCEACNELESAAARLAVRADVDVVVAGSVASATAAVDEVPLLATGRGVPRAVAVSPEGVVAAVGRPLCSGDLEAMAHAARHAVLAAGPGARREHSWGASVPYWEHPLGEVGGSSGEVLGAGARRR